jgi:hypothetical protein
VNTFLVDALTVAGFCVSLTAGYLIVTRLNKVILAAELSDGCTTCYLLGAIPYGPPYWMLRVHLRRVARQPDENIRQPAP